MRHPIGAAGVLLTCCLAVAVPAAAQSPTYLTAEVVSVDPDLREMVIRDPDGATFEVAVDEQVTGLTRLRSGDRVIVSLHDEGEKRRVSAVFDARTSQPPTANVTTAPVVTPPAPSPARRVYVRPQPPVSGKQTAVAEVPEYVSAEIVSLDAQTRIMVIRNPEGASETVELADHVGGMRQLRAGDRVILQLQRQLGRSRVQAIFDARTSSPATAAIVTQPSALEQEFQDTLLARSAFAERVAALSRQADRVEDPWTTFRGACDVSVVGSYDGGREWFALWDGRLKADLSSGFCRDLYNQIVGLGAAVSEGMDAAEAQARKELQPGTIREIRRRYAMDWDGWGNPAPEPLTP